VTARAAPSATRWVTLGEASAMLGITPGTLRRWADEGRVPVFTTPGGHRRFSSAAVTAMLPAERIRRPTLARLGASPERIARAYRSVRRTTRPASAPWIEALSPEVRTIFRDRGRELVAILLDHLDAADSETREARLLEARQLAAAYGREVAGLGLSLADTVEGFLRFRTPFTDALAGLAQRRGLDTWQATDLLGEAEAATDALLIALMTGHSLTAGERLSTRRNAASRHAR
jgi:excisionase family DNA binding protein